MRRRLIGAALVALTITAAGGCTGSPAPRDYTDTITRAGYNPSVLHIYAGDTVTWINEDPNLLHTVTARDDSFGSGFLGDGQRYTVRFNRPGTYRYFCDIHPSMVGEVDVT